MTDAPDAELLEQFVRAGSEAAFTALVQRHLSLVHSVALRHTSNPQQAQDITQAVFIVLARKAGRLGRKTILPGWLYHTARLTAANFQRAETRRIRHEQEAFMQSTIENSPLDDTWRELSPQLDEAMAGLGAAERDALVLRYFQNQSMTEIGKLLGLQENTAQKRIGRALEKLRKIFAKRGVISTTVIIAGALSAHSVQAAPATLAKTVATAALAKGATASVSTLTLVKGVLKIMAWSNAKTAIVVSVGILLAAATTTVTVKKIQQHRDDAWQLAPISSDLLTRPPFRTEILPTRASLRGAKSGRGGSVWMGDGRSLQINASMEDVMRVVFDGTTGASYREFTSARTIVTTKLPRGNYDYISSQPHGAREAMQTEITRKFGLTAEIQTIETNVFFLLVKTPNSPGLKSPAHHNIMSSGSGNGRLSIQNCSIGQLGVAIESVSGTPVVDQTGLKNYYDITVHNWPENTRQFDLDKLRQALNQQLGLDLVAGTASVDMLVIERAH